MNSPDFFGLKLGEDPQHYLDELRKITHIMNISKVESVELAFYRLKDVAYVWVVICKKGRGKNTTPMSWQVFQDAFLDRFFSCEIIENKAKEFVNLRQGSIIVMEYYLYFNKLSKYSLIRWLTLGEYE